MDLGIAGKTALVTGASGGLGLAVARALASEGAKVAICSRDRGRIEAAAASIDGGVFATVADMRDKADRAALPGRVEEVLGPIDILVINSGGPPSGPFEAHDEHLWTDAIDQHLGAARALSRAVLRSMRQRRWGRIVTVTSCSVKQPAAGMILSNTARAAVVGFARTLANEVAADGITVNNLMPGYTRTARIDELVGQIAARQQRDAAEVVAELEREIPMGRLGLAEEFAAAAAFICSDLAGYITGVSLSIDGGWNRSLF